MSDILANRSRKRPWLSPDFVRAMLAGHSALGLAFAALIYIVCLSGTLSVFLFELQRWEQPDGPRVDAPISAEVVAKAARDGYAQAVVDNAAHDLFISGPSALSPQLVLRYRDHERGTEGEWLLSAEGELVQRRAAPWSAFIADLHMHLHLPRTWGLFLVGLTGVALLSSLISGLLSHPRLFKDAFAMRWGGSRRLQDADLHNRLGVWGLPFHIIVSTSGALLGLSTLIVGVLAMAAYEGDSQKAFAAIRGPRETADETASALPDIEAMIRKVQAEKPGAEFVNLRVGHIGHAGQLVTLGLRTPGHLAFAEAYHFDGDGAPRGVTGMEEGSIGQQILGVLQPLHFGWFGGTVMKLVYGLLGLALTFVAYTGVTIWLARRRDKGRPAHGWERVWTATGWGQPCAFGVVASSAFAGAAESALIWIYLACCGLAYVVARAMPTAEKAAVVLRVVTGLAILSSVATHCVVWRDRLDDDMSLAVSATLVAIALTIAMPAVIRSGLARAPSSTI